MNRFLFVLGISLIAAGLGAAPEQQPESAQLLVVSKRTGNAEIFLANADGKGAKNLTNSKAKNTFPAWSPDGKKIAFTSDRDGANNIYLMDADGGNVKQLTKGIEGGGIEGSRIPSWTPDGKKIVFCRFTGAPSRRIFVMNADGSNVKQVGNENGADPACSPDGKQILFTSYRKGGYRLSVMDMDGGNTKELTSVANPAGYVYPAWSPDGKKIAWTDKAGGNLEIFVADPDGKNSKQLTTLGVMSTHVAWSPDSKNITFYSTPDGQSGSIYTITAAGENLRVLLADEANIEGGRPAWRPK